MYRCDELMGALAAFPGSTRFAIIDKNSGMIFDLEEVTSEVHDDADGSTTVWLKVEEM